MVDVELAGDAEDAEERLHVSLRSGREKASLHGAPCPDNPP
jgi:hypothetical protein